MSDEKHKVTVALTAASEACAAGLELVSSGTPISTGGELQSLQSDFTSLLSLLHSDTTRLSLVLKPSAPAYKAALPPLADIAKHTSALAHCTLLHSPHGQTLALTVAAAFREVVQALQALVHTFLRDAADVNASHLSTGAAGDEYMVRTGALHEIIERFRKPDGIPVDNREAVKRKWASDADALQDGFREVAEMIEEEEGDGGRDDAMDEGWGEIGLGPGEKMSREELERTRKVHSVLRLTTLLHKRVMLDILSTAPSARQNTTGIAIPATVLDLLLSSSLALSAASDDLVATLYTPQDPENTRVELATFLVVVTNLQTHLQPLLPELDGLADRLSILALDSKTKSAKDPRKWFETCLQQVYKSIEILRSSLSAT